MLTAQHPPSERSDHEPAHHHQAHRLCRRRGRRPRSGWLASDDAAGEAILDALEDNGVLVFRGLQLDPQAQVAFCRRLGDIDHSSDGHHPVAGIYPITLDKSKNSSAAYLKATFDWHIDGCTPLGEECPQKATVLSALQVAEWGGETEFANSYAAYDALTDEEKDRFGSLRVVHSLEASQRRVHPDPSPEHVSALAISAHPRTSIGVDASQWAASHWCWGPPPTTWSAWISMRAAHCSTELLERATVRDKVYSHTWSVGDTVVWDNRGVLHRAAPYDPDSAREMLRTTVLGDEPIQ